MLWRNFALSHRPNSAEYGRTPGGQFLLTTRSGINHFHGSVFDYFRNDAMDARMCFNQAPETKPDLRQNDFGGTFSGPVRISHLYNGADRTFFFFAYEGLRLHTPSTFVGDTVPSTCLRGLVPTGLQGYVNAYPIPTADDVACPGSTTLVGTGVALSSGAYSQPGSLDTTGLRIDHNINDRFKIFVRYNHSPSELDTRDNHIVSLVNHNRSQVDSVTAGAIYTFSNRLVNDLRFNYTVNASGLTYTSDNISGAQPWDLFNSSSFGDGNWAFMGFAIPGAFSLSSAVPSTLRQHQINVVDGFNYSLGRHNLKFGVDYRRIDTPLDTPPFQTFLYFTTVDQLLDNSSKIEVTRYGGPFDPVFSNLSLLGVVNK